MNPFTLIGVFLALFCATKYVNAIPVASDAAITSDNASTALNSDAKLDNLLYNAVDINKSSESVVPHQPTIQQTTRKPQNESQKPKPRRRRPMKYRRAQPDCRTEKPTTTKPTKIAILMPNLFISQSWGPGR